VDLISGSVEVVLDEPGDITIIFDHEDSLPLWVDWWRYFRRTDGGLHRSENLHSGDTKTGRCVQVEL
jgi:hypothetical protein